MVRLSKPIRKKPDSSKNQEEVKLGTGSAVGIRFNPDDTVSVRTEGGSQETISKEDFKRTQEKIGKETRSPQAPISPEAEKISNIILQNRQAKALQQQQGTSSSVTTGTQGIKEQQGIEANKLFNQPQIQEAPLLSQENLLDEKKVKRLKEIGFADATIGQLNPVGEVKLSIFDLAIDIADNLRAISTLGGKDTQNVKNAKTTIASSKTFLDSEIKKISTGEADAQAIQRIALEYEKALSTLESTNKRKGIDNLAYWLTDGRDLETELIFYREDLEQMKLSLDAAILANRLAVAQQQQLNQETQIR